MLEHVEIAAPEEIKRHASKGHLTFWCTLITSVLAVLAASAALMGGRLTTRGLVAKNEAILLQEQVTNQWGFFQSRNIRKELAEFRRDLIRHKNVDLEAEIARFEKERDHLYNDTKDLEKKRDEKNRISEINLDVSHSFASALILFQLSLVLVSVALLMKGATFLIIGSSVGAMGLLSFVLGFINFYSGA